MSKMFKTHTYTYECKKLSNTYGRENSDSFKNIESIRYSAKSALVSTNIIHIRPSNSTQ